MMLAIDRLKRHGSEVFLREGMNCIARTKYNFNRCRRKASSGIGGLFCEEHTKQPIYWTFVLVFTVLAGTLGIWQSIRPPLKSQENTKPQLSGEILNEDARSGCCIYLTNLVNPPNFRISSNRVYNPLLTASFAVTGNSSYILDSVTVRHNGQQQSLKGALEDEFETGPNSRSASQDRRRKQSGNTKIEITGGGCEPIKIAETPATNKPRFRFKANSEQIFVIDPVFEVKADQGKELALTFALEPDAFSATVCDELTVSIQYHSPNGDRGQLILDNPPQQGKILSRLVNRDVEYNEFNITPTGLQRGNGDAWADASVIKYQPVKFPKIFLDEFPKFSLNDMEFSEIPTAIPLTYERIELNKIIGERGGLFKLLSEIRPEEFNADTFLLLFDLCSALPSASGDPVLKEIEKLHKAFGIEKHFASDVGRTLATRHLLEPNENLVDFILKFKNRGSDLPSFDYEASTALALYPRGNWVQALRSLSDTDGSLQAFYFRRNDLSTTDRQLIHDAAWEYLPTDFRPTPLFSLSFYRGDLRPSGTVKYLMWYGHSIEDLERLIVQKRPDLAKVEIRNGLEEILGIANSHQHGKLTMKGRSSRHGRYQPSN